MNDAAARYRDQGHLYLAQAREEFAREDLMQASEKVWGAAAQLVKAAAADRGWTHGRHATLYQVVRRLVEETGVDALRLEFAVAGELHANFYEGFLAPAIVEDYLQDVTRFVGRVEGLLNNGADNGAGG